MKLILMFILLWTTVRLNKDGIQSVCVVSKWWIHMLVERFVFLSQFTQMM